MIDRIDEYKAKRKKRQLRRIIFAFIFIGFATLLSWFFESQATTTIVLTTHTQINSDLQSNSGLNKEGIRRADDLQRMLQSIDVIAGLDAIYATPLRATQETAEPLSKSLSMPINITDSQNIEDLISSIMSQHKGKIVLVVTHPDILLRLIVELQGSKKIDQKTVNELNKIFIVSVPWFGKVKTLQLQYGS
ncbi:MAG: histidine phosphatase family protein [Gammaproteobacteria bacterium]|jgi:broad specificity phosphatase PhoE|nr:histidine phosphatase family protein [Gammaproteobacteria bacterium]MBT5216452.1 histidine phosphatase family protein [Gammaproteobacteria bacterium]MBT6074588.1 histidine phosphatase family protein [Gammaproteobacteria bacterium]MDG2434903.1 phosphoglycerate mutase family protein [Gammaproteobacteria bacterium]